MSFARSERRAKTQEANHDNEDGICVAEIEKAATHFLEQKKNSNRHDDHRTTHAPDRATLAVAMSAHGV